MLIIYLPIYFILKRKVVCIVRLFALQRNPWETKKNSNLKLY